MSPAGNRWRGALLVVSLLGAGCTSFQAMGPAGAGGYQLQPGDEVEVVTKDGSNYRFTVIAADAEAISEDGIRVPVADIATLKRNGISVGKTAGLAAGSYVLLYGIPVVIGMAAVFGL